jgi:hypothetical protein
MQNILSVRHTFMTFAAVLLFACLFSVQAQADIVGTVEVVSEQQLNVDRNHLMQELNRSDVRAELERFGVNPDHAQERVAAMTATEVSELASNMDQLAVGGDVGVGALLLIIIIILLLT